MDETTLNSLEAALAATPNNVDLLFVVLRAYVASAWHEDAYQRLSRFLELHAVNGPSGLRT